MNIPVRIRNASQAARRVRAGFVMPEEVEATPEDQWLFLPAGTAVSLGKLDLRSAVPGKLQRRDFLF